MEEEAEMAKLRVCSFSFSADSLTSPVSCRWEEDRCGALAASDSCRCSPSDPLSLVISGCANASDFAEMRRYMLGLSAGISPRSTETVSKFAATDASGVLRCQGRRRAKRENTLLRQAPSARPARAHGSVRAVSEWAVLPDENATTRL